MRTFSQNRLIPLIVEEGESAPPEELTALTHAWLSHPDIRRHLALVPLWIDQDDPDVLSRLKHHVTSSQRTEFELLGAAAYYLSRLYMPELRWRRPRYASLKSFSGLTALHLPDDDGFQGEWGLALLREQGESRLTSTPLRGDWVASCQQMVRVYLDNLKLAA